MADTVTPNLGLTSPQVAASQDTWGTKLDTNNGIIDGLFIGPPATPALKIANGGTGALTAAGALQNLGIAWAGGVTAVGTTAGTVAAGNDTRITNAAQNGQNATFAALTTQTWTVTGSDIKLKDNIRPMPLGLTYRLNPVKFDMKRTKRESWGFIYQDIANDHELGVLGVHNGEYGGIQYEMIIAAVVADLQALKTQNDLLSAKVAKLEKALGAKK